MSVDRIEKLLEEFRSWVISEGLAISTIDTYVRQVRLFLKYIVEKYGKLVKFNAMHITSWISQLKREGKSDATIDRYTASLKRFIKFLIWRARVRGREDLVRYWQDVYNAFKVKKYDMLKHSVKWHVEPWIVEKAVQVCLEEDFSIYYCTVLAVQYETGLRFRELQQLKIRNVKETEFGFIIEVPDSKTESGVLRKVPIVKYQNLLRQLLGLPPFLKALHPDPKNPDAYLFPHYNRSRFDISRPITQAAYSQFLKRLSQVVSERVGLPVRLSPRRIRHACAKRHVMSKVPEQAIMKLMGWRKRTMIDVYSKVHDEDAIKLVLECEYGVKQEEKNNKH